VRGCVERLGQLQKLWVQPGTEGQVAAKLVGGLLLRNRD